jgi:hypothetical protein
MEKQEMQLSRIKEQAERYYEKYKEHMTLLEDKSILSKVKANRGGVDYFDIWSLGKQLEQFEYYKAMCEDQGNVNMLGQIPNIAFDVITAVHGASILPIVASVQPIEEERGTIYFKNVRSASSKGSQSAGSVLVDPRQQIVTPSGYASNALSAEVGVAATVDATLSYSFTLAAFPVKSESLVISLGAGSVQGKDIGAAGPSTAHIGRIWGSGIAGTVNYLTGVVSVDLSANPGAGQAITCSYQQNYELSTDLPQIDTFFDSKGIFAQVYALKGTIGMLQSFGMSKRFGLVAEDELAKDLVQEINREIGGDLIRKLRANAPGATTTFSRTTPAGVSYFEHKQTYKDKMAEAERVLVGQAGRGTISLMIVGKTHAQTLQTLPGFQKMYDGNSLGAHVFGTLDGMTIVRVTESNILGDEQGIALWKGSSPFEAAAVYAPFMPLAVTSTLPQSPNPMNSMKAAAVWAGVDTVVPNFSCKFDTSA